MKRRAYLECYGCNRRMLESSKIKGYLITNGYEITDNPEEADYIVVTTCAFKEKEEQNSVSRVEALRKHNRKMLIYGCLPDLAPSKFRPFLDILHLAPRNLDQIDNYFEGIEIKFSELADHHVIRSVDSLGFVKKARKAVSEFEFSHAYLNRFMSSSRKLVGNGNGSEKYYLVISRGCMGQCTYCRIKYAIGSPKSKRPEAVLTAMHKGLVAGYRNFVILGDDIGSYGLDRDDSFPDLLFHMQQHLREICAGSAAVAENGGVSLHVKELHPKWTLHYETELLELFASKCIKSLLCPVQSGSNKVLGLMRREHQAEDVLRFLTHVRRLNPRIFISTHLIVGFPSETDADFEKSLHIVEKASANEAVIFAYHEKEGTISAALPGKIPADVIETRMKNAEKYFSKNKIRVYRSCPD
ncbi:MAG: radical SAM protein [Pseudomonadota bacterium]